MIRNAKVSHANGQTTVTAKCIITKEDYTVIVPTAGYMAWQKGELIQRALPHNTAEEREFLISGTSPAGWASMFGGEED